MYFTILYYTLLFSLPISNFLIFKKSQVLHFDALCFQKSSLGNGMHRREERAPIAKSFFVKSHHSILSDTDKTPCHIYLS